MKAIPQKLSIISMLVASAVMAEEQKTYELQKLVVGAEFHPNTLETTPISITQIDSEAIKSRGANHIEEVLNIAPNVNLSSGASRGQYFQIRGMGQRGDTFSSPPLNPSVGLIIDGIDLSRTGSAATLFDIDNINILRGPQGTTYGSNALAGVITMQSVAPSEELKIHAETGIGNYGTINTGVAVGGALIPEKLLGRMSIYQHSSDGYMKNDYLNRDDTQEQDELTGRAHLKWLATDDLTVNLNLLHLNINNGYDAFTLDNTRHTQTDEPGIDTNLTNALALNTDWNINSAITSQSTFTYAKSDIRYAYDGDWLYATYPDVYTGIEKFDRKRKNYSFETKLLSGENGQIFAGYSDWTIGLYYLSSDESSDIFSFGTDSSNEYKSENTAIFGQLDTHLNEKLTLITGLRVEYFDAEYKDSNNINQTINETLFGGKLGLNYQFNPEHFGYTSISRGYKPGGFNNNTDLANNGLSDKLKYDTEYAWDLEAGLKSFWLDRDLITNMNVFYIWRKDAQVKSSTVVGTNQFLDYIENAAKGHNTGLEGSMDWMINDNFRLLGSLGLLYAVFDDYDNPNVAENPDGRRQAQSPSYTFSLGGEYYLGQNWTFRANIEGKDEYYTSNSNDVKTHSYALTNASVNYQVDRITISLWGRNLFDKDYYTRGFYFNNDPTEGYDQTNSHAYYQYGDPRTYGVSLSYDY